MYDQKNQVEAWRRFIATGDIDEEIVRPEIARSWKRCRAAGVNPWSSDFPPMDEKLLAEKQRAYAHSLATNTPVMRMVVALLNCNVSLMDQESFVFGFQSPLSFYPRTFGTYVLEEVVGTGNATIVPYEKKPVRVEGFEQYRAIAQTYSGVSAPYLDSRGIYFGAMNFNDPFGMLPEYALDMCATAVDLANELFLAGRGMWAKLSTAEFFKPLVRLVSQPVVVLDRRGNVLIANEAMHSYLPRYETFSYGAQSISAYLSKKTGLKYLMETPVKEGEPIQVVFKEGRKKEERALSLLRRSTVDVGNGLSFVVCVFSEAANAPAGDAKGGQAGEGAAPAGASHQEKSSRKSLGRASARDVVDYVGESDAWKRVDKLVRKVAPIKTNVLLLGETGSGKEVVARALHRMSGRKGAFVAINCGAIPRDLFAAELFGYEAGAFTGAKEGGSIGKIEAADGGTLFLDEIGEMPLDLQVGLLRVIQEQSVTRLGSTEPHQLDVRFLAATNQNVRQLIDERRFRADLYYRLSMVEIVLPPLREREGDVALLVDHFNKDLSAALQLPCTPMSDEVMGVLSNYTWPGNVRELRNVVERSLIMAGEGAKVTLDDLPVHVANAVSLGMSFQGPAISMTAAAAGSGAGSASGAGVFVGASAGGYGALSGSYSPRPVAGGAFGGGYGLPMGGGNACGYGVSAPAPDALRGGAAYPESFDTMANFGLRRAGELSQMSGEAAAAAAWQPDGRAFEADGDGGFSPASSAGFPGGASAVAPRDAMAAIEADRARIADVVRRSDGDLFMAAEALGMPYASLRTRMAELGIRVKTSVEIE